MTKTLGCEAIISDEVRIMAGLSANDLPELDAAIRGRAKPMTVRSIADVKVLSALIGDGEIVAA
jgi:adenylate cyclase